MLGKLNFFARGTRSDIAETVSRLSGELKEPTVGLMNSLQYLCGYLNGTVSFRVGGMRPEKTNVFHFYSDANHHGDRRVTSKIQTGTLMFLNGIPVHWRSNRQPVTADSPAVSEIYALKDAVRDGRLLLWVAEEMGVKVKWPFVVQVDSTQARSFKRDTCPKSRTRGAFDLREDWVKEVRNDGIVETQYVHTDSNLADMFTKRLPIWKFQQFVNTILSFQSVQILEGQVYLSFISGLTCE